MANKNFIISIFHIRRYLRTIIYLNEYINKSRLCAIASVHTWKN
ncbi:MAG: hypothetical protein WA959_15640 [Rivularia sp. (in: cyanobacteria)]